MTPRGGFERLSPAHRRELVRSIEDARTARNRAVRIERTLQHLRGEGTQQPRPAVVDKSLWTCPRCGHAFMTRSMSHSCDHLDLGFWFTERDEDPRFSRIETIATNVHVHRVRIRAPAELDGAVRRWIDRAHRVGCREHLQPRP